MSIHKEGYRILAFSLLILLLLNIFVSTFWVDKTLLKWTFLICSFILYIFLIFFFRRPERALEPDPELVFAPADGKVVVIEETEEMEYFKDTRLQVSIFMSPFNVHSNRYPVSGRIKFVRYHPGNKMVAWHPKSSELNERSTIVIETKTGKEVLVRQVAGAVARRIVTYAKENQEVMQGDELGFIKFGSRVDIFLPPGTEVMVSILKKVRANKSIIAKI